MDAGVLTNFKVLKKGQFEDYSSIYAELGHTLLDYPI